MKRCTRCIQSLLSNIVRHTYQANYARRSIMRLYEQSRTFSNSISLSKATSVRFNFLGSLSGRENARRTLFPSISSQRRKRSIAIMWRALRKNTIALLCFSFRILSLSLFLSDCQERRESFFFSRLYSLIAAVSGPG